MKLAQQFTSLIASYNPDSEFTDTQERQYMDILNTLNKIK